MKRHMLLALAALALVACGPTSPAPAPTPEARSGAAAGTPDARAAITFGIYESARAEYTPLVERFNAENPDMRVQLIFLDMLGSDRGGDQSLARMFAGAADTFAADYLEPDAVQRGYLRDLAPLIDADPSFARDDFFPGAIRRDAQGAVAVIPATLSPRLLAYNRDLWAARGLAPPEAGWGWGDLRDAAAQIAGGDGDNAVYGLLMESPADVLRIPELSGAGDLLSQPPERLRLDDAGAAEAADRVLALLDDGTVLVPPAYPNGSFFHASDYLPLLGGGRLGMWDAGLESQLDEQGGAPQLPFVMGLAAFPQTADPAYAVRRAGYAMSAGTAAPELAWRWLSFLSRQPPPQSLEPMTGAIPARRPLAEAALAAMGEEAREATEAALANMSAEQTLAQDDPRRQAAITAFADAITSVRDGGENLGATLAAAQSTLEERLAAVPTPTPGVSAPFLVSTPPPEVSAAPDAARVTFGSNGLDPDRQQRIALRFNRAFPQYFVEVVGDRGGSEDIAGGTDCFASWSPPATDQERAALLDLQPLADADAGFAADDYPPALLAPYQRDGKLYGLPLSVTFRTLFYNRELFDAAGLAYPRPDWTLDDMLAAAAQLTQGAGEARQYGFASPDSSDMLLFLGRRGVALLQGSGAAARPDYASPALVDAVGDYLNMLRAVSPNTGLGGYSPELPPDASQQLIDEGRVAMWFGYGVDPLQTFGFPVGVAPLPRDGGLRTDDFFVAGVHISATGASPAACWAWLRYLSDDPDGVSGFPARRSVAEAQAAPAGAPGADEVYAAYREALREPPAAPVLGDVGADAPAWDYWLMRAADRALKGADLAEELADAQFLTEQYLACVRAGEAPTSCTATVDPEYNGWVQG